MQLLSDIWVLTTENPVTMGTGYAVIGILLAAIVLVARR
jgi:hypothetical protein